MSGQKNGQCLLLMTIKRTSPAPAKYWRPNFCIVLFLSFCVGSLALADNGKHQGVMLRQFHPIPVAFSQTLRTSGTDQLSSQSTARVGSDPGTMCDTQSKSAFASALMLGSELSLNSSGLPKRSSSLELHSLASNTVHTRFHPLTFGSHLPFVSTFSSQAHTWRTGTDRQARKRSVRKHHKLNSRRPIIANMTRVESKTVTVSGVGSVSPRVLDRQVEPVASWKSDGTWRQNVTDSVTWKDRWAAKQMEPKERKSDTEKQGTQHDIRADKRDGSPPVSRFASDRDGGLYGYHLGSEARGSSVLSVLSSSNRTIVTATLTPEPRPRRKREQAALLLPANHEERQHYFTAEETCRRIAVSLTLQPLGCLPVRVVTTECQGSCHSRSIPEWHHDSQQLRHIQYCTCCKPHQVSYRHVTFQCPERASRTIMHLVGGVSHCACRPCSAGDVRTRDIYDYDD